LYVWVEKESGWDSIFYGEKEETVGFHEREGGKSCGEIGERSKRKVTVTRGLFRLKWKG